MIEMQKKLTNTFYAILALPATAMGFALSIQIAALSWILNTQYKLDIHEIGFVWAAGPLAGIIGQVTIGLISDKVWFWGGRRRPFIIIGGVLAALMLVALPNIDKISSFMGLTSIIVVATIVALTLDLAINVSFNPTRSVIADVTPEGDQRTKGYTWMQTISGFFGVMAYFMGVMFGNYVLIYAGAVIVLLFSIIPLFFITESKDLEVVTESKENKKEEPAKGKTETVELLKIYMAHAFSWIGVQTMFVYIIAFIQQKFYPGFDFSNAADAVNKATDAIQKSVGDNISYTFMILNIVGFIVPAFVLEPISEKLGRVKTHVLALALMAAGYLGIAFLATSPAMLYILIAICGIGWGAIVSLPFAIMSEKVAKGRMGLFMGIFNLSVVLPQLAVSLFVGTIVLNMADKNIIFIISGVSLAISAVLWLIVQESKRSGSKSAMPSGGGH